ncbi:hypothetical protein LKL95_03310 [Bacillus cereus]|uniref:McrC family protein n=1 Tax=Bacillus cereus TaxID=1396 RepID=UPI0007AB2789|nr:hypothetical protein [Bacillus cereus]KZD35958.1 hypothetical protein B4081_1610 [Bacillus cereus]MCC2392828.1 hypothetical protein [Bacillus cereus]MCU5662912.1 hypothetical protein [Bacillus cereus]MCU5721426.1 hypothetical protein [Bacillus cereus]
MDRSKYKVPIRNLFCILCYANEMPELVRSINSVDKDLPNLMVITKLFIQETNQIIKRNLYKDYRGVEEDTSQIKGKVLFNQSMQQIANHKAYLTCEMDEFDENNLQNQLLKTTLINLMGKSQLPKSDKINIQSLLYKFSKVNTIKVQRIHFFSVQLNRSNLYYRKMLLLARIIFELQNMSEQDGEINLFEILNDEKKMQKIFEKFILNFYRYEQNKYQSRSEKLKWDLGAGNPKLVPDMNTDISLFSKDKEQKIIIDAKYYSKTLIEYYDIQKIRSSHLYQLYAYLSHSHDTIITRGILVYPTNGYNVDETYTLPIRVGNHVNTTTIRIFTVDLSQEWEKIECQMFDLLRDS